MNETIKCLLNDAVEDVEGREDDGGSLGTELIGHFCVPFMVERCLGELEE